MSANPDATPLVRHNAGANRFEIETDGHLSLIDYVRDGREITFTHTFVPVELRGRGLAEQLVQAALSHAWAEQLRVIPACSYVARYIQRHAEYQPLLG